MGKKTKKKPNRKLLVDVVVGDMMATLCMFLDAETIDEIWESEVMKKNLDHYYSLV